MEKATFWVLIETDADRFDNPDKPGYDDIQDVLRNTTNYGIVDVIPESDISEIVLKDDK